LRGRRQPTVLTPHTGEFAFLAGRPVTDDRVSDVRERADEWNAVVHLKGRRAVTAAPTGEVWINTTGNPGAATAGSGDVLTGIVGSFVAQGMSAEAATWGGAYVHGESADLAASHRGERSMTAGDIAEAVAAALERVGRARQDTAHIRTVIRA
jgi:NAD(P)H-hydrate epimerase